MSLPIKLQLPEHFLDEEIRCETVVTTKMKKIWAVELDLLNEFSMVCKKHNLTWYIAFGSLIGTIRHKGFIPWDNDIDVLMPRTDYRKLCEIAKQEFIYPYFLHNPQSEEGRRFSIYAKLCNSKTTGAIEEYYLQGVNAGLSIDIFILDDIPDNNRERNNIYKKGEIFNHCSRFLSPYKLRYKGLKFIYNIIWKLYWTIVLRKANGDILYQKLDETYGSTIGKGYNHVGMWFNMGDKTIWERKWFESATLMPFEMLHVPVPVGYDMILRKQYGDYLQFPPIEQRATHDYLDMDPEVPYIEYFKNKFSK